MALITAIASRPPAAPKQCPIMDLVAFILMWSVPACRRARVAPKHASLPAAQRATARLSAGHLPSGKAFLTALISAKSPTKRGHQAEHAGPVAAMRHRRLSTFCVMPASWRASLMQVETPRPSARGSVMWWASQVIAPPRYSAMMFAPRFCACSRDSITSTPAPSPITKPSRVLSHGREAPATASKPRIGARAPQRWWTDDV
eukprot:scaffold1549_cov350-Prasinococcus_capsulatus_cf.AAC.30